MQDFFVCQRSGSCWGPRAAMGAAPTLSQPLAVEAPALPAPSRRCSLYFPSALQAITTALLQQFVLYISTCSSSHCQALPQPSTSDYQAGTQLSGVMKAGADRQAPTSSAAPVASTTPEQHTALPSHAPAPLDFAVWWPQRRAEGRDQARTSGHGRAGAQGPCGAAAALPARC